jgi:L-2-hydroxyglutarate oxidase
MAQTADVAIVGGGIVGLATAYTLTRVPGCRVIVLEAESGLARHQTGHNSGVIHSGLYYKPGSLKALNCTRGREAMYRFCAEQGVTHERCGKLVVAVSEAEIPALNELERRGRANGLDGMIRLRGAQLQDYEPHVAGLEALWVPTTGIVDFPGVTEAYARLVIDAGSEVRTNARVVDVARRRGAGGGDRGRPGAGASSGELRGVAVGPHRPPVRAGPRGADHSLPRRVLRAGARKHHLVRNLIYPVPDPRFPFLGVHFTRMAKGGVEAGPNAVLAFRREGYDKLDFSLRDSVDMATFPGFWRMAGKFWKTAAGEFHRSFSKEAFVTACKNSCRPSGPSICKPGGAGVRAQAVTRDGALVDDFRILESERMIHVLNAPSPAATASLSIGRTIAELAEKNFGLAR